MPRELSDTAPTEAIGRYYVQINNHGSILIWVAGSQTQLTSEESHELLAYLIDHSTETIEETPAHE